MNFHSTFDDDIRFDRLVDGEMSRDEYREFLIWIEQQPDGWRRCAHAFLEAQALRSDMAVPSASRMQSNAGELQMPEKPAKTSNQSWPAILLAVAFSFLISMGLTAGVMMLIAAKRTATPGAVVPEIVENDTLPIEQDEQAYPQEAQPQEQPSTSEMLALVAPDGQQFEVPIYNVSNVDDSWPSQQGEIPPELRREIEASGHEIQTRRQLVPVSLEDGRQMVVPVDEIQITPVNWRRYQ